MSINLFLLWIIFPFGIPQMEIIGKWQMVSFEAFTNILLSPRHYEADEADRFRLEQTFQMVLDSTYYDFREDTVFFSDYKNYRMIEKVGLWNIKSDTLYINDLSKIQTYKYLIKQVDADSLVLNLFHSNGKISKNDLVFTKK